MKNYAPLLKKSGIAAKYRGARRTHRLANAKRHRASKEILDAGYHSGATYFQNQLFEAVRAVMLNSRRRAPRGCHGRGRANGGG